MKKIYLYVAFALASIGMISCTDILDQDPLDSFTDEAVWNDLALSETYLNAQYMNLMAENMKGTRFAHYTDEVFQKHTYGSENVTQGLLSCDNAGIGWDDTMWDPWYSYYQYISKLNLFLEGIYNQLNTRYMKNLFKMYRDWRNRKFVEKIDKLYFHKDKQGNRFMKGTLLVVYDNKTGAYGNVMACLEEDLDKTLSKVSQIRIQLQKEMKHYHDIKSKLTYGS